MKTKQIYRWCVWLAMLGTGLGLSGCLGGLSGESYEHDEHEPPGPSAHEYRQQAEAMAEQGLWLEAAALQTSGLPWAEQDWNAPRGPDEVPAYQLLSMEGLLGEALLEIDKQRADAAFTRLWSRRDHPSTIKIGTPLWHAAKALQKAGDHEFARRMYIAAAQTQLIDFAASSIERAEAYPFVARLREMGFEQDATEVERRLNEAKVLHASETVKAANARAETQFSSENQLELARLYAQGYEYFGNQRLADAFRREAVRWEYDIQEAARKEAAYEHDRQARAAARQAKEEEGSGFMTFINALSGGLQAYAGSRGQGATAAAGNVAALSAAAQAVGSGSGSGDSMLGATVAAAAGAAQQYQAGGASAGAMSAQQQSASASAGASRQRKPVRNATHCVGRDRQTGTGADYLSNSCDFKISVTWFSPEDSICRSGCAGDLKAHQPRSSVSKLKGGIVHAACEYPHSPKNPDGGRWTGAGQHICVGN